MAVDGQSLMSKTQHYRKVTKPLLERKRRARMNLYLDELKDLIVETMETNGEHVSKLEKADILEMTVTYLKSKKGIFNESYGANKVNRKGEFDAEKFRAGYTQAAYEVSKVFASVPELDLKFGSRLMEHLGYQLKDMKSLVAKVSCQSTEDRFELQQQYLNGDEQLASDVWRPW